MGKWKCRTVLVVIPLYGLKEEMEDMIMKHEYVAGEKNDIYIENSERKSVLGKVLGTYAKKIKKIHLCMIRLKVQGEDKKVTHREEILYL